MSYNTGNAEQINSWPTPQLFAAVKAGGLPAQSSLVLQLESNQFDGTANGTSINTFSDGSGKGHDFTYQTSATNPDMGFTPLHPTVDGTNTANGHKTLSFIVNGSNISTVLCSGSRFLNNSATGLTMAIVAKWLNSPPSGSAPHGGAAGVFTFRNPADPSSHQPYIDGNFYENFGTSGRIPLGTPGVNLTSRFRTYMVVADSVAPSYKGYMDFAVFGNWSPFVTYSVNGGGSYSDRYSLGACWPNVITTYAFEGSLAACYVWEKALTGAEQTNLAKYLNTLWGTITPF